MNENEIIEAEIPDGGLKSLDELNEAQYIRAEFITPVFRPKVTLNYNDLIFNTACVRLMDDTEYVQMLVLLSTRRLVVMPCNEHDKDSVKWSIIKNGKAKSRYVNARIACGKLYQMMNWNVSYRYKVMAVYQIIKEQRLIVFNLDESEMYVPDETAKTDGSTRIRRRKVYPIDWEKSFGSPYSEHKATYAVDLDRLYLLSNDVELETPKPAVDGRTPTAKEIITREYYKPDDIKDGGDKK